MSNTDLAWIHLENLKFFLYLGATQEEQKIGQNITINLSLQVPYCNTKDNLKNTVDYGEVYCAMQTKLKQLHRVHLLEYLAEQLLQEIENKFPMVCAAKIVIKKGYVPLKDFSGTSKIEAHKQFCI